LRGWKCGDAALDRALMAWLTWRGSFVALGVVSLVGA